MNILVTNDDGIDSEGLLILEKKLNQAGHSVFVLAPDGNRSAISHGITMFSSSKLERVSENRYKSSGTPADCVITALRSSVFPIKIDAVFAGINKGANLGTDIIYSGTCAAARQAVLYGVPGIAFSIENYENGSFIPFEFDALADFASKNAEKLVSLCKTELPYAFVNINAPSKKKYNGAKLLSDIASRSYFDTISIKKDSSKKENLFITEFHGALPEENYSDNSDLKAVKDGFIAISVVLAEPVSIKCMDDIVFSV